MSHDPMCFESARKLVPAEYNCECDLIARVREDEANRKPEPPHDQHWYADNLCSYCIGYAAALRDAVVVVKAVNINLVASRFDTDRIASQYVAAIEGLEVRR